MKVYFIIMTFFCLVNKTYSQTKLYTKTGTITFKSKMPIETIEAVNNKVLSVWETSTGNIEFSVLIKGFTFEKALMQEHFNENYMDSDKYPKATFKGTIENSKNIVFSNDATFPAKVTGAFTLHGITKQISISAIIKIKNAVASAQSTFIVLLEDYNIKIPAVVQDNINKRVEIFINIPSYQTLPTK